MKTVLIVGANRGIGLEFCQQYADMGWNVIACCRNPELAVELNKLIAGSTGQVLEMDVLNRQTIDDMAYQLKGLTIDLLVANAGIYGDSKGHGLGDLDYVDWIITMETNVMGIVKVIESFLPNLLQSKSPLIAALSSQMGSIDDNSSGGSMLYRTSKAALNAAMKTVSVDLKNKGIGVLIFHPGWVKTTMGGPHALINPEASVSGMVKQLNTFDMTQTGLFMKYDGTLLPW